MLNKQLLLGQVPDSSYQVLWWGGKAWVVAWGCCMVMVWWGVWIQFRWVARVKQVD